MHVILEGIAPMEVKNVLKHIVLSGQLDLAKFNSAVLGYPYSSDVQDRPCPIIVTKLASNDNKLKQASGQMLVLLKISPFVLDSCKINADIQVILDLIEIVQILFAPVITLGTISNLKLLTRDVHFLEKMRTVIVPNRTANHCHRLLQVTVGAIII